MTDEHKICASIPATKPFFTTYLPLIFGSMSSVPSSDNSPQRTRQRSSHTVVITAEENEEEMLTLEKVLGAGKSGTASVVSRTDSRGESEEDGWIRVTQTVELVKEEP
jgi:hypothetical protein